MSPSNDLQARWLIQSGWLPPATVQMGLDYLRAQNDSQKDLCDLLCEYQKLNQAQAQQIRHAVRTFTGSLNDTRVDDSKYDSHDTKDDTVRGFIRKRGQAKLAGREFGDGRFEIIDEISRGGMGVVLKVRDKSSDQAMALKLMLEEGFTEQALKRFNREIDVLAALDHPSIVKIYECGFERGLPFYVMDYLTGRDLSGMVKESLKRHGRSLDCIEIAQIMASIAEALAYCHSQGVVHRDVKPSNILVEEASHHAVLVDFGVVKGLPPDENMVSDSVGGLSLSGELVGTPAFMSPEQLDPKGGFGSVSPASDVWSFGAALYFALTGRKPYDKSSFTDLIAAILAREPAPPRKHRPDIPAWLNDICVQCLIRDSSRRVDMLSVAEALREEDWLEGRQPRMSKSLWLALALTVLMIIGAGFGVSALLKSTPEQDPLG